MRLIFRSFISVLIIVSFKIETALGQSDAILITRQPVDQTMCAGVAAAYFSLEARAGCAESLDFQWFVSADDGQDWQPAPSGKSASFSVAAAVLQVFGHLKIKARVSGTACEPVESIAVNLIGEGALQAAVFPKTATVIDGGSTRLEAKSEAAPAGAVFGFQWQRSFYATGVFEDLAGETRSFLDLKSIEPALNGSLFRARITGAGICERTFSAPATLFVQNAPLVSVTPKEKSVCEHGTATFGLQVKNGTGSETVQWQVSRDGGLNFADLPGETARFFKAEDLMPDLSGAVFRAVVTLASGAKIPSSPGKLFVNGTVAMAQQPSDYLACVGDSAVFAVRARATGNAASYQWQESRDGGKTFSNLAGRTREQLAVGASDESMNGWQFRALVTAGDCQEMTSETAALHIVQTVHFEQNLFKNTTVGSVCEIETRPSASPGSFLNQWQWSIDGSNWTPIRDANQPKLMLTGVPASHDGRLFRFKVFSKECGRIQFSEPITLKVGAGR